MSMMLSPVEVPDMVADAKPGSRGNLELLLLVARKNMAIPSCSNY